MFVVFRAHPFKFQQTKARHERKIMMSHVDTNVVRYQVQRTAVCERFIWVKCLASFFAALLHGRHASLVGTPSRAEVGVVLSDEMTCTWMKSKSKESRHQKVKDGGPSSNSVEPEQKHGLDGKIQVVFAVKRFWVHDQWADSIEEGLEQHPEELPERCCEEVTLKFRGDISIDTISTLESVMFQVILLEGCRIGDHEGKVGKVAVVDIVLDRMEEQVVGHFMNRQCQ